jgi:heme exporter protein B
MTEFKKLFFLLHKDFLIEFRTREIIYTILMFSLLLIVIFSFAFYSTPEKVKDFGSGIIWCTILFSATIGLNSVFAKEKENDMLSAVLLSPVSPKIVLISKVIFHFVFTASVILFCIPLIAVFFDLKISDLFIFISSIFLGTAGMSFIGVLFSAMLINARLKDVLLPLVLYPLIVPLIIAGVKSTGFSIGQESVTDPYDWLKFMLGFDLIFIVLSIWLFEMMVYRNNM